MSASWDEHVDIAAIRAAVRGGPSCGPATRTAYTPSIARPAGHVDASAVSFCVAPGCGKASGSQKQVSREQT